MKNYYAILGVTKDSSEDEVKKKYRDLAKIHHPDKGGDAEKFKEIQEAYDVLSNPQKKNEYDNPSQGGFGGGFEDFFQHFNSRGFGGFSGFGFQREEHIESLDIHVHYKVPFSQIYQNKKADINFQRTVFCGKCDGMGVQESDESAECLHCQGSGRSLRGSVCQFCNGVGQIHSEKCSTCNGTKHTIKTESIGIDDVFMLTEEPQTLAYRGVGHASKYYRGRYGNLHITLIPEVDKRYTRMGSNLICEFEVDYRIAINGGEIEYKHLDDKKYKIKIPANSNKGSKFKLTGLGCLNRDKRSRGDLYLDLSIVIDYSIPLKDKKNKNK